MSNQGTVSSERLVETAPQQVALVLAGAGARGAYEAGFFATLLPHLDRSRPRIIVGTSAGAINAALITSLADEKPADAANAMMNRWRTIDRAMVLGSVWQSLLDAGVRYCAALAGADGPESLLDTRPLKVSLASNTLIDWNRVSKNIDDGHVDVLAVATTECGSGRTKIFYQTNLRNRPDLTSIPTDDSQAIDYVRENALTAEHVRASAAIPVFFPPVRLPPNLSGSPTGQCSFHMDGGVRLNAPLKPAIKFGADGIIVISTDAPRYGTSAAVEGPHPPGLQDQIVQIMRGTFADRMIEDIQVLLDKNRTVLQLARSKMNASNRYVPLVFGGPSDQDDVGSVAARTIPQILRGLRRFKHADLALLNFLTSVSPISRPDLISYLLFEPEFLNEAIKAGIRAATALLNQGPPFKSPQPGPSAPLLGAEMRLDGPSPNGGAGGAESRLWRALNDDKGPQPPPYGPS
jgi:NTE family protein